MALFLKLIDELMWFLQSETFPEDWLAHFNIDMLFQMGSNCWFTEKYKEGYLALSNAKIFLNLQLLKGAVHSEVWCWNRMLSGQATCGNLLFESGLQIAEESLVSWMRGIGKAGN